MTAQATFMLSEASEKHLRYVRFFLLAGWCFILFMCLVDIGQDQLTEPDGALSLDGLVGSTITLRDEVFVARPYNPATRMFWGVMVPIVVLVLLFAGHDTWRRICPLSAVSQIPRWLGYQRKRGTTNTIALINQNSFIARYAILIQFSLFSIGVWLRLTLLSANPFALFIFTLGLFSIAFVVGLLYGGKTWCHYFCPMNAVQMTLSGPRGLNASAPTSGLSQSMCRKPSKDGDISSCVGCNSPCPDVDIERNYWESLATLPRRITVYGYLGVVIAFIHGLYAATGDTSYGAAVWYDSEWSAIGYSPFGELIHIPKILGALALFVCWILLSILFGLFLEKLFARNAKIIHAENETSNDNEHFVRQETARHHSMTITTTVALFLLIHKIAVPGLAWLPEFLLNALSISTTAAIAVWAYRSWNRTHQQYQRESLAESLRRKLGSMLHSWKDILSGRVLQSLSPDELHIIAELAPNLSNANKLEFYRAMVADTLEQGTADTFEGRKLLSQLRTTCNVSDDEHKEIVQQFLGEYDINDTLFVSSSLRSESFRKNLERIIYEGVSSHKKIAYILQENAQRISKLRSDYAISEEEEAQIVNEITNKGGAIPNALNTLISQITELRHMQLTLNDSWAELALGNYLEFKSVEILRECFALIETLTPTEQHTQDIIKALSSTHPNLIKKYGHELAKNYHLPENFSTDLTQFATAIIPTKINHPHTLESTLQSLSNTENKIITCIAARAAILSGFTWADTLIEAKADLAQLDLHLFDDSIPNNMDRTSAEHVIHIESHSDSNRITFKESITAGRSKSNDWVITQPQASRKHFLLNLKSDGFYCTDLNSSNGTLVNGKPLHNDTIKLPLQGKLQVAHDARAFKFQCKRTEKQNLNNTIDVISSLLRNPMWLNLPDTPLIQLIANATMLPIARNETYTTSFKDGRIWIVLEGEAELTSSNNTRVTLHAPQALIADKDYFEVKTVHAKKENSVLIHWDKSDFDIYTNAAKEFQLELYQQNQKILLSQLEKC